MPTNASPRLKYGTDYRKFILHPHNRDVTRTRLLEESMRQHGFVPGLAIRCVPAANGKVMITHGHHRFEVAKKLGIGVWYILDPTDVPLFDSEAPNYIWNGTDFTVARARAGEQPAQEVLDYHEETGIPISACIALLGGSICTGGSWRVVELKKGTFEVNRETEMPAIIKDVVLHCLTAGVPFASSGLFVQSLARCLLLPEFDVEQFKRRVTTNARVFDKHATIERTLEEIEKIYNWKTRRDKFMAIKVPAIQATLARKSELQTKASHAAAAQRTRAAQERRME